MCTHTHSAYALSFTSRSEPRVLWGFLVDIWYLLTYKKKTRVREIGITLRTQTLTKESGLMGKGIIRAVAMAGVISEGKKCEPSYLGLHCVHTCFPDPGCRNQWRGHALLCVRVWCVHPAPAPRSWCYPAARAAVLCPFTCEPPQCPAPGVSHVLTHMRACSGCPRRPPQFLQGGRCSWPGCPFCPAGVPPPENQADFSLGAQSFGNLNKMNSFSPQDGTQDLFTC